MQSGCLRMLKKPNGRGDNRMEASFRQQTIDGFLQTLGSDAPAPGGGAAAGIAGALGAALGKMVADLTLGRKKYADHAADAKAASDALQPLIERFAALADADAAAYDGVMRALAMPKDTEAERALRADALQIAIRTATDVPCAVIQTALEAVGILEALHGRSNTTCVGDLAAGAASLKAAGKAAWLNVLANLPYDKDRAAAETVFTEQRAALSALETRCDALYDRIAKDLEDRI